MAGHHEDCGQYRVMWNTGFGAELCDRIIRNTFLGTPQWMESTTVPLLGTRTLVV